jgi:beta-galactosidase
MTAQGGRSAAGGAAGSTAVFGGAAGVGGGVSVGGSGGAASGGGSSALGGAPAVGGTEVGGETSSGGSGVGGSAGSLGTTRTIMPFDSDWRFIVDDPIGADQVGFVDSEWRTLRVPHDWSIEGPFDETAKTGPAGGFLPSGVGWYRKHFVLPESFANRRVFIEFDGVMANSDVYLNGTLLGSRPYGYVSFRYELTDDMMVGLTENVLAVRVDNSAQPASRWYTGAGIYRHVRLIATELVHVDKWATFVSTPVVSTESATVQVKTSVTNQGAASAAVTIRVTITEPGGGTLPQVTSETQTIAQGTTASFSVDLPVTGPMLWSVDSPNLYGLTVSVQADGVDVDDDRTSFGIRSIDFEPDTGFFLNGESLKLKGVCLHHDMSGLGAAVPLRAMQRRLSQLKGLGVNAIRTSHNPVDSKVLDLFDRMGFLVMEEFFDVWKAHKETADYATNFDEWATVDMTDTLVRDRNHPSVILYSIGNEIRDSVSTRLPIATEFVELCHTLDPTRPVTQGLFRPKDSGDYPGATLDVLDIFGANYRVDEVAEAISAIPHHVGVITEVGPNPSGWTTIANNPQIIGEFLWTGADYLGEADAWPNVGFDSGLLDRVGTIKDMGYRYQEIWSSNPVVRPTTSTGTPTSVVVSVDHATVSTDQDDVAYVQATIVDSDGAIVTTASNPVTFELTGSAASIIAVDSGSIVGESFRGTLRNAYQGRCFAIVQGTVSGTVSVAASSPGLAGASVTIQSVDESFVPCSGTCD